MALLRASEEPLVVLLDLKMPTMSGLELLHALATEPEVGARHAYIIFSASRAFISPMLNLYLPDKRLFDLPKPFNLDHLVAIVERATQQLDSEGVEGKAAVGSPMQASDGEGTQGASES